MTSRTLAVVMFKKLAQGGYSTTVLLRASRDTTRAFSGSSELDLLSELYFRGQDEDFARISASKVQSYRDHLYCLEIGGHLILAAGSSDGESSFLHKNRPKLL